MPTIVSAQRGLIVGRVRAPDGTPIASATVTAESTRRPRTAVEETNTSGRFAFIGLSRGPWIFKVEKLGYQPSQGVANIRRTGRTNINFVLEVNPFRPPVPDTGVLAGLDAEKIQAELAEAHALFDRGDFDSAIDAYELILARVPQLTSLNLQIGHAYFEKRDFPRALTAYRSVPVDTAAAEEAASAIQTLDSASVLGR